MVPITNSDSNLLGLRVRFSTLSSCSIARPNSPLNLPSVFHLGGCKEIKPWGFWLISICPKGKDPSEIQPNLFNTFANQKV